MEELAKRKCDTSNLSRDGFPKNFWFTGSVGGFNGLSCTVVPSGSTTEAMKIIRVTPIFLFSKA